MNVLGLLVILPREIIRVSMIIQTIIIKLWIGILM
jgi:hypothetical protein